MLACGAMGAWDRDETTKQASFAGSFVRDDAAGPMVLSHRAHLVVTQGPDRTLARDVSGARVTIGSARTNDFVLSDPTVSRHHCEITVRDERYVVRDLGSKNGTRVEGTFVFEAPITPGATVGVGDTNIAFEPKKRWVRVLQSEADHFGALYGTSRRMREIFALLSRVADSELSCVIVGETGTGKELAARGLHDASERASGPFVVVDCGAISETLVESELFGHERGAFTGADRTRAGAFELADHGTIFLDEIGELPMALQPKLLRALERREIKRLGAEAMIEVDVRVVAATHRDLQTMVEEGRFREDLFYRLAEGIITLPPLRERLDDLPILSTAILGDAGEPGRPPPVLGQDGLDALARYAWPGNVRELRNVLKRAAALGGNRLGAADMMIDAGAGPPDGRASGPRSAAFTLDLGEGKPIREARDRWVLVLEREYLERLVTRHGGPTDAAAAEAGVHRKSLLRLMREHGMRYDDLD